MQPPPKSANKILDSQVALVRIGISPGSISAWRCRPRRCRRCRSAFWPPARPGRPAIVATQMLDSMVHAPTPTRAEASDVATAVYDGADAVMLSAKSASGQYPVEAVTIMDRIIKSVEGDPLYRRLMDASRREPEATTADAISAAARQCAHTLSAAAIVTYTNTGSTTLRAARERPDVRILCLTPNLNTARRMTLTWGVHPVQTEDAHNFADMVHAPCASPARKRSPSRASVW